MNTDHRFQDLLDIDETAPFGENGDRACFDALEGSFRHHNMGDRFAVTLLHTHFEIQPDENLVEDYDSTHTKVVIHPTTAERCRRLGYVPCSWRLTIPHASSTCLIPLQWAHSSTFNNSHPSELRSRDIAFAEAVAGVLLAHGKLNRFGLCFAKIDVALAEDECLLETANGASRELHLQPSRIDIAASEKNVQTSWRIMDLPEKLGGWFKCRIVCHGSSRGHDDVHR